MASFLWSKFTKELLAEDSLPRVDKNKTKIRRTDLTAFIAGMAEEIACFVIINFETLCC